jgi:LacI family transcriptional regulator
MLKSGANIKDVARRAGVHPSTVSRVLNPATRSMVSEGLAEEILRIADELGYRRNPLASGLRTRRTYTVGVIIPDITNPVFPPIVRAVEHTLDEEGYIAILADSGSKRRSEKALVDNMRSRQVDGMILAAANRKDPLVDQCIEQGIPVVLVNRSLDRHNVSAVINDDELGIDLAVEHLVELGHREIAYIGGPQRTSTGYSRYRAFLKSAKKAGIAVDRELVINAREFTESAGQASFHEIARTGKNLTAVLTANDLLAIGVCDALAELGMKCPRDISVTGFNDMPYVDRFVPPLTTLHIPHDDLGVQAAKLLLEKIENPDTPAKHLMLEPRLIVRGSTGAPPQANRSRRSGRAGG